MMTTVEETPSTSTGRTGQRHREVVIGLVCIFIGASLEAGFAGPSKTAALKSSAPNAELQALTTRIETTEKNVTALRSLLSTVSKRVIRYQSADLNVTEKGFTRIDSNGGTFYVSLDKADAYLNGYKLNLRIGNPSTATFDGVKLTFLYGEPDKGDEWQTKEITSVAKLSAGAWTHVEAVIAPATAAQLGYVHLVMETNTLSLRNTTGVY
jgi:hypothetical protein